MFKEAVSLAIVLGFMWNILYVDHPNARSYTLAFLGSLVGLSPFVLAWLYWCEVSKGTAPRDVLSWRYWHHSKSRGLRRQTGGDDGVRLRAVSSGIHETRSVSGERDDASSEAKADIEKGMIGPVVDS